jgi:hypothetical protein
VSGDNKPALSHHANSAHVTFHFKQRDNAFWLATQLRDNGYSQSEAEHTVRIYVSSVPKINAKGEAEDYLLTEAFRSIRQAYSAAARKPWTRYTHSRVLPTETELDRKDLGYAMPGGTIEQRKDNCFEVTDRGVVHHGGRPVESTRARGSAHNLKSSLQLGTTAAETGAGTCDSEILMERCIHGRCQWNFLRETEVRYARDYYRSVL